jgi:hypothetical protein
MEEYRDWKYECGKQGSFGNEERIKKNGHIRRKEKNENSKERRKINQSVGQWERGPETRNDAARTLPWSLSLAGKVRRLTVTYLPPW